MEWCFCMLNLSKESPFLLQGDELYLKLPIPQSKEERFEIVSATVVRHRVKQSFFLQDSISMNFRAFSSIIG